MIDNPDTIENNSSTVELNKTVQTRKNYSSVRPIALLALLSLGVFSTHNTQAQSFHLESSTTEYRTSSTWNTIKMTEAKKMERQYVTENKLNVEKIIGHKYVLSDTEWIDDVEDFGDIKVHNETTKNRLIQSPYNSNSYTNELFFLEEGDQV